MFLLPRASQLSPARPATGSSITSPGSSRTPTAGQRIQRSRRPSEPYQQLLQLHTLVEKAAADAGLDQWLIELVKIRGSMLNGCSFCLDLHTRNARKLGETERRIYLLGAWRETNLYTEQERAALALTDAMTLLPETQDVPDEVYAQAIGAAGQTRRKLR